MTEKGALRQRDGMQEYGIHDASITRKECFDDLRVPSARPLFLSAALSVQHPSLSGNRAEKGSCTIDGQIHPDWWVSTAYDTHPLGEELIWLLPSTVRLVINDKLVFIRQVSRGQKLFEFYTITVRLMGSPQRSCCSDESRYNNEVSFTGHAVIAHQ